MEFKKQIWEVLQKHKKLETTTCGDDLDCLINGQKNDELINDLFDLYIVSQQRELLLAFLKCYNNGDVTEYGINEVDDFLKHNS